MDSVFHTNRADAVQDLTGDALDTLVADLESVEFMVIDVIKFMLLPPDLRGSVHEPPKLWS